MEKKHTMRIVLPPNTVLSVCIEDEHGERNDGEFLVEFTDTSLEVRTEWPDDSEREGVIYSHHFGPDLDSDIVPFKSLETAMMENGYAHREPGPMTSYGESFE